MKTSTVEVGGLLSALSSRGVDKRFMPLPGVHHVEANYVAGSATVTYDEKVTDLKAIKAAIEACGYHCGGEMLPKHVCEPQDPPASTAAADAHAEHEHHAQNGGHAAAALLRHAEQPPKAAVDKRQRRIGPVVTMNIKRIAKHLLVTPWQVNRAFSRQILIAIEKAIEASETAHVGEIRFVVEGALDGTPLFKGQSARERAIDVFSQLRIWDTEHNNGVLIYPLLADRDVEIVADRGIHAKVGLEEWEKICRTMETAFKQGNYEGGVVSGIQAVTRYLKDHFPAVSEGRNELLDKPVVL